MTQIIVLVHDDHPDFPLGDMELMAGTREYFEEIGYNVQSVEVRR